MADIIKNADNIDSVDLNELRSLIGDSIFVAFFNAIKGFLSVDDDSDFVVVKKKFVRNEFIYMTKVLIRK